MDMFAIGEKIGVLDRRMTDQERRSDRQDKRLDLWSRNIRRLVLVLTLWTLVLIGMSSTDAAAEFAAAVLRKFLMPS
jgi:hypothetical protein